MLEIMNPLTRVEHGSLQRRIGWNQHVRTILQIEPIISLQYSIGILCSQDSKPRCCPSNLNLGTRALLLVALTSPPCPSPSALRNLCHSPSTKAENKQFWSDITHAATADTSLSNSSNFDHVSHPRTLHSELLRQIHVLHGSDQEITLTINEITSKTNTSVFA
jgi:hypothetical protein